ncbi:type I-E CRISPR-associated protein Cas5/CasD [Kitasatospora sp. NPDC057223]|uniref:type I-E CRISPR-associated protein Cas5/CasD n=1 Tax=Kitasatospora sp. NPDC057223 TaxID=3346055 RepID=UPI0036422874
MSSGAVLLLRLAGPLQSWGDQRALVARRTSAHQPTKSGVVGLVCAAVGHERDASPARWAGLRFGVRVDQPGTLLRDYRVISDFRGGDILSTAVNAKGVQKSTGNRTNESTRYYLQDAVFVAALEGEQSVLEEVDGALRAPVFTLSLGRKCCPPSLPLSLGLREGTVESVLAAEEWHARAQYRRGVRTGASVALDASWDSPTGEHTFHDQPVSFDPLARRFTTRRVHREHLPVPTGRPDDGNVHDPLALLGW